MSEDQARLEGAEGMQGCPAPDLLLAYHRSRLSGALRKQVRRHLRGCPACARDSRFVAIIVRDEIRLIRGLETVLPGCKETHVPSYGGQRRISLTAAPHYLAATAVVAGILLALFIFPPSRRFRLNEPIRATRTASAESVAAAPLAVRMIPKRPDIRDRLIQSGLLVSADYGRTPAPSPRITDVLASFEISQKRDREAEFFGWSLATASEMGDPFTFFAPR